MTRIWFRVFLEALLFAVILFGAAGSLHWAAGWVFLICFFGPTALITAFLARENPEFLRERAKSIVQREQPLWDRVLMSLTALFFLAWLAIMSLDARRFRWTRLPLSLQVFGFLLMISGFWIVSVTFKSNRFAVPVVKLQKDRGQRVIDSGPYAVIRHPMYAGALCIILGSCLLLASALGLIGVAALALLIVARTTFEERALRSKLEGYATYARRVRWRLLPGLW